MNGFFAILAHLKIVTTEAELVGEGSVASRQVCIITPTMQVALHPEGGVSTSNVRRTNIQKGFERGRLVLLIRISALVRSRAGA